jgi:type II secretory pathway component PulJ
LNGATLTEALVASVIIVTIIAGGFVVAQQHMRHQSVSKLKLKLIHQAEHYLEQSINQKDYYSYLWDTEQSKETYRREVTTLDADGIVQINISANHPFLDKPIILSRIVEVK